MKKIALLLILTLMLTLAACGAQPENDPVPEDDPAPVTGGEEIDGENADTEHIALCGGWNVFTEQEPAVLPDDAQKALEGALAGYAGTSFTPVVLLATRASGEGTVYALLCRTAPVVPNASKYLSIVVVDATEETPVLSAVKELPLTELAGSVESNAGILASDVWTYSDANPETELDEYVRLGFDTAYRDFAGPVYKPIALLGTQVVAGSNYAILCEGRTMGADAPVNLYVTTIFHHLDGGAEVLAMRTLDLEELLAD